MDIKDINCQPHNWYIKIENLDGVPNYTIEKGRVYMFLTNILLLEKILTSDICSIKKTVNIFFVNYKIFRQNTKIKTLLKTYNFSDNEMELLLKDIKSEDYKGTEFEYFHKNLTIESYTECDHLLRAILLIEIQYKNSPVAIFNTAGSSFESCEKILQQIFKHIKKDPEKAAIIIDETYSYIHPFTKIKILSDKDVSNYRCKFGFF
jgi:hypothetical protein